MSLESDVNICMNKTLGEGLWGIEDPIGDPVVNMLDSCLRDLCFSPR